MLQDSASPVVGPRHTIHTPHTMVASSSAITLTAATVLLLAGWGAFRSHHQTTWRKSCKKLMNLLPGSRRLSVAGPRLEQQSPISFERLDQDDDSLLGSDGSFSSVSPPSSRSVSPHLDISHPYFKTRLAQLAPASPSPSSRQPSPEVYPAFPPGLHDFAPPGYYTLSHRERESPPSQIRYHGFLYGGPRARDPSPCYDETQAEDDASLDWDDHRHYQQAPLRYDGSSDDAFTPSVQCTSLPADSRSPECKSRAFEHELIDYDGRPTQAFMLSRISPRESPLVLTLTLNVSDDPEITEKRYNKLSEFLTSPYIMAVRTRIHSIDITIPYCDWNFESPVHCYDQTEAPERSAMKTRSALGKWICDGHDPARYHHQFPNLVEFGWNGMLGRRRGDGAYAALPSPFYDLVSLPFGQLRRLSLAHCLLSISDLTNILRSTPVLETLIVDTVVDVGPYSTTGSFPAPDGIIPPLLTRTAFRPWPISARSMFLPVCLGSADIDCPKLTILRVRTTVGLDGFFSTARMPELQELHYEPVGTAVGNITRENIPWNVLNLPKLHQLTLVVRTAEKPALDLFEQECVQAGVCLDWFPSTRP